ncbi:RCC1/BLIP-II [Jackrogersella minutella]|nr:RCC1/BLIP-II [Jackrogersella minutella]
MPPKGGKAAAATAAKSTAASKKTASKAAATGTTRGPKAPSRASSRAAKQPVNEDEDDSNLLSDEPVPELGEFPTKPRSRARTTKKDGPAAKPAAKRVVKKPTASQNGGEVGPSKRKRGEDEEDESEEEVEQASRAKKVKSTPPPKAPRAKPAKKSRAPRAAPKKQQEDEIEEVVEEPAKKSPKAKKAPAAKPARKPAAKPAPVSKPAPAATPTPPIRGHGARGIPFNDLPSQRIDVFVFGEGSSGELGLGSRKYEGKKPIDVKRPRLNHNLQGVVALACGGMHCVALTHDRNVLTWGVNDDKALGRDTFWEGGTRDIDDEDDDEDDDDTGLNPRESTPGLVDLSMLPEGTMISQVAATDSASFIVTDDGWVYGWGTFRGSDGIIGFSDKVRTQPTPAIIPGLKNITKLACGSNHVLALDLSGKVFTWGSGGQFQLGRKPLTRLGGPTAGLNPQPCGKFSKKHRAVQVGAGSYHSFYIDDNDQVWSWGLNNYAQTGLSDNTGEDDAMVLQPQIVQSLGDVKVAQIVGGEHHSVACTTDGQLLTWGRVDGHQVGQPSSIYTEDNALFDSAGKPRILLRPTPVNGIKATFVATGTDTSFALDAAGKVYSWGFSANYQTGQGTTDDIEVPTMIDNSAIRDRQIIWAGAGGQFSIVAAAAAGENLPNGN